MRPSSLARRSALLLMLAACVEGPGGPGHFGEVRVEPVYRAAYQPAAIGVTLDSASVLAVRRGTGETVLDRRVAYGGGSLAYVIDLAAQEDSFDVTVELWSGGERMYAGDTAVAVESGSVVSGQGYALSVAYVGPPVVASVTVTPGSVSLTALGATQPFAAEGRDPDGAVVPGAVFAWTSSNGAVATVDAAGLATVTGEGSATITASAGLGSGSAGVTVDLPPTIASVVVTPGNSTLIAVGATQLFAAQARDSAGNAIGGVAFNWTSSNESVATVDAATGLATARGHGTAIIYAATGSVSGSAGLTVSLAATIASVVVTPGSANLAALGATQAFAAEARDAGGNTLPGVPVTWSSSDESVATIDVTTGTATATGHGSATITAHAGTVSGSASLTVSLAATVASVVVTPASAGLTNVGATQAFAAEARDAGGHVLPGLAFTWSSSDAAVATMDASSGVATATGHGSATITARTGSVEGSASLTVTLAATVASVVITPASAELTELGATQSYTAEVRDAGGNAVPGVPVTWSSLDESVATIDPSSGGARATGHGTATIIARAGTVEGGATLTVTLTATVASVVVTPASAALSEVGATQLFTAQAMDATGSVLPGVPFTWSSDDEAVATIDEASGVATASGHGASIITATVGAVSGSASLTVTLSATVAAIVITPSSANLTALGASQAFVAEARDAGGNVLPGVPVSWSSSNTAVAEIDAEVGLASAAGHGTTTITATAGSVSGSASLTVTLTASVASVVVSPASVTLTERGATQVYTAQARDADGNELPGVPFTWTSSDAAVAAMDGASGLATAVDHGSVTITATTGTVSGSAALSVDVPLVIEVIVVTPDSVTLTLPATSEGFGLRFSTEVSQQFAAEARDVHGHIVAGAEFLWFSTDSTVATVDETGFATGLSAGVTQIKASAGGKIGRATLTVAQAISLRR